MFLLGIKSKLHLGSLHRQIFCWDEAMKALRKTSTLELDSLKSAGSFWLTCSAVEMVAFPSTFMLAKLLSALTFSGVGSAKANVDGPGALGEEVVGRGSSLAASGAAASFSCRFLAWNLAALALLGSAVSRDSPRMQRSWQRHSHSHLTFVKFHESGEEEGPLSKMSSGSIHGVTNCL